MSVFDKSDNISGTFGFPEGAFERLNNKEDELRNIDPSITQDIIIPPPGGTGGDGITSIAFDEVNDDTAVISGSPVVTPGGTLTRTAVDATEDAFVMWDESEGKKVYYPFQALVDLIEAGGGGGAGCVPFWTRYSADGVDKVGSGNISTSRISAGKYLLTGSSAFEEVGGFAKYGVLPAVSAAAGDGGDGVSPFRSFSGYDVSQTDLDGGDWFPYPEENEIVLLGQNTDDLWRHDLDNFTATPVQTDAEDPFRAVANSGCINREGTAVWFSGDNAGGGIDLRHMDLATGTITHFPATDTIVLAATETYIIVYEGSLKKYAFNLGTGSLGSTVATWTALVHTTHGTWDADGRLWFVVSAGLVSIDPSISGSGTGLTYAFPNPPVGLTWYSSAVFDTIRNCLYVPLTNSGVGAGWVYKVSNWQALVSNSIAWEMVLNLGDILPIGIWHDTTTDILFITNYNLKKVHRVYVPTWTFIDTTVVNSVIGGIAYTLVASRWTFYRGTKGYCMATGPGPLMYFLELQFDGDPIPGFGSGSGSVSSVLTAMYEIISTTQAYVYVFRTTDPPQFADAECTVQFVHCDEDEGGGGGGGGISGPIDETDLEMTGPAILGRLTGDTGAILELPPADVATAIQPYLEVVSGPAFIGNLDSGAGFYEEITPEDAADAIEPFLDMPKAHGQCFFRTDGSGTSVHLIRHKGEGWLIIDGVMEQVPAGLALTATNTNAVVDGTPGQTLANSTLYYVYAFMDSGTMTLEFSATTGPEPASSALGVAYKNDDPTRTLVGLVRTTSAGLFANTLSQRFLRSYFHDPGVICSDNTGTSYVKTSTSGTYGDLDANLRCEFIVWSRDSVTALGSLNLGFDSVYTGAALNAGCSLALDGTTISQKFGEVALAAHGGSATAHGASQALSEGYHYLALLWTLAGAVTSVSISLPLITCRIGQGNPLQGT